MHSPVRSEFAADIEVGVKEVSEMDVNSYCENLTIELTGWKAKIYDIVRKLDNAIQRDLKRSMLRWLQDIFNTAGAYACVLRRVPTVNVETAGAANVKITANFERHILEGGNSVTTG